MDQQEPSFASPGVPPADVVTAALAQIDAAVEQIVQAGLWAATDRESRERVKAGVRVQARVDAALMHLVKDLDSRDDAVPGSRGGKGTARFLREACRRSAARAKAEVKAARLLADGDLLAERIAAPDEDVEVDLEVESSGLKGLPRLGMAYTAGQVWREHVDGAIRAVGRIPARLLEETDPDTGASGWDQVDVLLTGHARQFDPSTCQKLAGELLDRLDPDGTRSFDPDSHLRRYLSMTTGPDGMTILRGQLDPAAAAVVRTALDHFSGRRSDHPMDGPDGEPLPITDQRSPGMRYADALTAACRLAMDHPGTGTRGGEPPHITVHTTTAELNALRTDADSPAEATACRCGQALPGGHSPQLGPISPGLLARLACTAIIDTVTRCESTGAVLDLGRSTREPNAAIRRAVTARDRGCVICAAPPERTELHHVRWWSRGGTTSTDNLALACDACHTQIHLGTYDIEIRDGVPWIRPPDWIDARRRWRRPRPHHEGHARQQSHQLALDLLQHACPDPHRHGDPPSG
jgi:hypothetical protein